MYNQPQKVRLCLHPHRLCLSQIISCKLPTQHNSYFIIDKLGKTQLGILVDTSQYGKELFNKITHLSTSLPSNHPHNTDAIVFLVNVTDVQKSSNFGREIKIIFSEILGFYFQEEFYDINNMHTLPTSRLGAP